MLSTENPPPDLQCPCEISQLIKSSNDDKGSDDIQHKQHEVDLSRSGLDDSNPLPKFSIRDYVFDARSKDVKKNWPFSLKNLQLCLKYGVKDVLPPFQSLDSVRKPSIDAESAVDEYEVSDQKVAEDTRNIDSSGCEEDKVFPSTTTSQSCSDINSVKNPSLECLPGSPLKKLETVGSSSNKVKSNIQNPAKKCKFVLKLKNIVEPKANTEDLSVNDIVVSDTMATKVCPVCKTFSSSSNTTLNAHIDQCLSGESSVKWTTNSKEIKHRIKARKTRLMVDIYETAVPCTLEDLDKRNGTNWASNLGFPDQDLQTSDEEKNKTYASVNIEDNDQEGSVYIDSNGTKLLILSKLGDPPSNAKAAGQTKLSKRDKGNEVLSCKKKKLVVQKHKIMKSPPHVQRSCPRFHLEVDGDQEKNFRPEGYKDDHMQPLLARHKMKSDGMGMIKQWVGSRRSGLKKKINLEDENRRSDRIIKNSVKSGASSLEERDSSSMSPISPESDKRKATFRDSEPPCREKTQGYLHRGCDDDRRNSRVFSKPNVKHSRKDDPLLHESVMDLPNTTENHGFSQRNKKMIINISPVGNSESPFISSKSTKHEIVSGSKKFLSPKKKSLSVRHTSVQESKKKSGRKHLGFKNHKLHCPSRSEEEMIRSKPEACRQENLVGKLGKNVAQLRKASAKSSFEGARVLKIQKQKSEFRNTSKGDMAMNSTEISPESDSDDPGKNNDSFARGNVLEKDKMHDEFAYDPTDDGEKFAAFSKSLETAFTGLDYPTNVGYVSQQYNGTYQGNCLAEPSLGDEKEELCVHKIGGNLITSSGDHVMVADEARGNYFVDVDPIPIPGPPGSFLPSPGRMSSEGLPGNSSLTACMMQSSENEPEVVDTDSSDSPISATSVVSDSVATRSNSVSVNLPEQSHNETHRDISKGRMEPAADGSTSTEQARNADRKSEVKESKSSSALPEMTAHRFKGIPSCCCSRKDVALLSDSFPNQESQFIRQQTISSRAVMPDDRKEKAHLFNLRSERLPPTPESGKFMPNSPIGCGLTKFPFHGDCESPSPSPSTTSNPVLRLMGKNLMVANKDENLSLHTWPAQLSMAVNHSALRLHVDNNTLSTGKNQNELCSFHPTVVVPQGSSVIVNMQDSFGFNPFDGFKTPANVRPPWPSAHLSGIMIPDQNFGRNFIPPLKCREYSSLNLNQGCAVQQNTCAAAYDIKNVPSPVPNPRTADSSGCKHKEIIVIDESPGNEAANLASNRNMKFGESSAPAGLQCVNPFYNYQTRGYPSNPESPMVQNGNSQVPSPLYFSPGFS